MDPLIPITSSILLAWSTYQILRPPRVFQVIVGGRLLTMAPTMSLVIPEPGPIVIETQTIQIPPGGAFFRMDAKGNLRMVTRP